MKKTIFLTISFLVFASIVFAQKTEERSGAIFLSGNPDDITIKKNIAFQVVLKSTDNNYALARNIAFYEHDNIVLDYNIKKRKKVQANDTEYLNYILGKKFIDEVYQDITDENQKLNLFEKIAEGLKLATVKKIYYDAEISIARIENLINKKSDLYENLSVIVFIDTTNIDDDIHIDPKGEKINRKKMVAGILEELQENWVGNKGKITQIFRTKGFNVKSHSQEGLDTSYYCMVKFGGEDWNDLQRRAFFASADYYAVVAIDNISMVYDYDPSIENAENPSWQITNAELSMHFRNTSNNDEVTYIRLKNSRTHIAGIQGNEKYEYRLPFGNLMYEDIAPQLAMSSTELEAREEYSEFFPQAYQYLGLIDNQGYEFRIVLEKTTRYGANELKKLIEKKLGEDSDFNFDFEVKDFEDYTYKNCFCEQASYVILKNCKFDISDFNGELQSLIEKEYGVSLKKPKSPIFFTLLKQAEFGTKPCNQLINWNHKRKVTLCPEVKYPNYKYYDEEYEIETEDGDLVPHRQPRVVDGKIQITLAEGYTFKKGKKYSIYFGGGTKVIEGTCDF